MKVIDTIARTSLALVVIVLLTVSAYGQSKLLITEFVQTPTAGEFVEIYNPGGAGVDLTNVYLTDATFSGGNTYYYQIVNRATVDQAGGGGSFGDWFAQFPDGASIDPGEFQTISLNGSTNFFATYGVIPTYELFEEDASPDTLPDM